MKLHQAKPATGLYTRKRAIAGSGALLLSAIAVAPAHAQRALGLDISAWQGNISQTTWNNIKNVENRQFVFLRSSRGGTTGYYDQNNSDNSPPTNTLSQRYDDPYFVQNINRATTAGMYAGSYHFSRPDVVASTTNSNGIANTGTDEANHFIQMAGAFMRPGYLIPTHDLEAGDGIRTDNQMAQFNLDFSNRIYEVMGFRPAVYINGNYASNILAQSTTPTPAQTVAAYPVLWTARWPNQANPNSIDVQNGNPNTSVSTIYGPWDDTGTTHPWHFWQYASTGRLNSFNNGGSNLDFDVAHGGVEYLRDHLVPALWMNNNSGDWTTLANWNSGQAPVAPVTGAGQVAPIGTQTLPTPRLPGAAGTGVTAGSNDTVILDRPTANITVTHASGTTNIRKLYAKETLNITGGTFTINYVPAADSTPISAQFSSAVTVSGTAAFSVHSLQVDPSGGQFNLNGGTTTFRKIDLLAHASTPGKIVIGGDVTLAPLVSGETAEIKPAGSGAASGRVELGSSTRTLTINNGTAATDVSIQVPITGTGGLTKAGLGTLALTATNTFSGPTTISAGVLNAASFAAVNSSSAIGAGSAGGSAADLVLNGGTLQYTGSSAQTTNRLFSLGTGAAAGTIDASSSNHSALNFTGAGAMGFTGSGARTLTLTGSSTGTNTLAAVIGNSGGSTSIVKNGIGSWTLSGNNAYTGNTTVNTGTLGVANSNALGSESLTINGTAIVRAQAGLPTALNLASLTIAGGVVPTATLNLNNDALVVRNATLSTHNTINEQVEYAFNGMAWNRAGITSTTVQTAVGSGAPAALGILFNNDGAGNALFYGNGSGLPQFAGRSVDASSVLVKQTFFGDGNLDGIVNSVDFALFQAGFDQSAPYVGFAFGDYNYDGSVNSVDFGLFQAGMDASQPLEAPVLMMALADFAEANGLALGATTIPEPAGLGLFALGFKALRSRRRK